MLKLQTVGVAPGGGGGREARYNDFFILICASVCDNIKAESWTLRWEEMSFGLHGFHLSLVIDKLDDIIQENERPNADRNKSAERPPAQAWQNIDTLMDEIGKYVNNARPTEAVLFHDMQESQLWTLWCDKVFPKDFQQQKTKKNLSYKSRYSSLFASWPLSSSSASTLLVWATRQWGKHRIKCLLWARGMGVWPRQRLSLFLMWLEDTRILLRSGSGRRWSWLASRGEMTRK